MAGPVKQMLGTETCVAMRAANVLGGSQQPSIICGLSANDLEQGFLSSGATSFMMKPFPCAPNVLKKELNKLLDLGKQQQPNNLRDPELAIEANTDAKRSVKMDLHEIS